MLILNKLVYYDGIKNPKLRGPEWEKKLLNSSNNWLGHTATAVIKQLRSLVMMR